VTGFNECNGDVSPTRLSDQAEPQLIQVVVEAFYAHCPRDDLKPATSTKHCPSSRLNHTIWQSILSKRILVGLPREKSAVFTSPNCAVENENRYPVLLSHDYIPSLSDLASQVTSVRERNWGMDLAEIIETPKTRSAWTDILETVSRGKSSHRLCAHRQLDDDNPKEQRHDGDGWKQLKQSHSGHSESLTPGLSTMIVEIRRFHSLTPTDGPSEWRLKDGAERPAVGFNATLKRLLFAVPQTRKSPPNILAGKLRQNLGKELSAFKGKLALSVG
jgi:hypothetical protein